MNPAASPEREFLGFGMRRLGLRAFGIRRIGPAPAIYLLPDGFEIEIFSPTDIVRRRIFFTDVRMLTLAPIVEWVGVVLYLLSAILCAILTLILIFAAEWFAPLAMGALTAGLVAAGILSYTRPPQVISIFGRRLRIDWARSRQKTPARERYDRLAALIREAVAAAQLVAAREQAPVVPEIPASAPPPVPMPPPALNDNSAQPPV